MLNHEKRVKACALYDIDEVYVAQESLSARNLSPCDLISGVVVINDDKLIQLTATCDHYITF
jgi:sulfur relay (sulfurtransferase) DsrF/TusC family protein